MSRRNIVHVEIPAANVESAGKFYQDLFAWKIQPMPEMNYTIWEAGNGDEYGGFPQVSDDNPAGQVLVYIASDDIEADLKKVENSAVKCCIRKQKFLGWVGLVFFKTQQETHWVYTQV